MPAVKIIVVKWCTQEDIAGQEATKYNTRKVKPICGYKVGREFVVNNLYEKPEGLCSRVWNDSHDLISLLFKICQ